MFGFFKLDYVYMYLWLYCDKVICSYCYMFIWFYGYMYIKFYVKGGFLFLHIKKVALNATFS